MLVFRLDFEKVELAQPTSPAGVCASDTLVATGPTGTPAPPTNICGTLTGQHSK